MLRDQRGTNHAKIEKISIYQAIWLEFLRSLVSAIRYEANKINRLREERPIGSLAVKTLRDARAVSKISIIQSILLGFPRALGSATSYEANKRVMLSAEWTITAR